MAARSYKCHVFFFTSFFLSCLRFGSKKFDFQARKETRRSFTNWNSLYSPHCWYFPIHSFPSIFFLDYSPEVGDRPRLVHITIDETGLNLVCCDMKKQLLVEECGEEIGKAFKLVAGTVINAAFPTIFKVFLFLILPCMSKVSHFIHRFQRMPNHVILLSLSEPSLKFVWGKKASHLKWRKILFQCFPIVHFLWFITRVKIF